MTRLPCEGCEHLLKHGISECDCPQLALKHWSAVYGYGTTPANPYDKNRHGRCKYNTGRNK